jgi:hypothetical protein
MSRWTKLGIITDTSDREVTVFRHDAGDVRLIGQEDALEFDPAGRDKLREMLDRAAMTGQRAAEGMCREPRECPNGPDDHPFVPAIRGRNWCTQADGEAPAAEARDHG